MSKKISEELLKIMNEIADIENTISKIDAAIFVRTSSRIIKEKVAYLHNILHEEANIYGQSEEKYYEEIQFIINHYTQKLNMVYDEFYCQYVNIQNELQEARLNKDFIMINYQKTINKNEQGLNLSEVEFEKTKKKLRVNNEIYNKVVSKCNEKFGICKAKFEKRINDDFLIISTLQIMNDKNIFQKIKYKITNLFSGSLKYTEILGKYNSKVDKIDATEIVNQMREETIDFVTEIVELRMANKLNFA